MSISQIMYTARVTATGGRDGEAVSDDGHLKLKMAKPKEMGGNGETADTTNPEQLFAAGYAACFLSALNMVARKRSIPVKDNTSVTAEVGIGQDGRGYALQASLNVSLPGMEEKQARALVEEAHTVCPYSNATRNNIDVKLVVDTK